RRALSHVLDPPGGHAERCCLSRSELVERARARACRGRSDATRELSAGRLRDAGGRARCRRGPNRRRAARRCGRNGGAEEWLEIAAGSVEPRAANEAGGKRSGLLARGAV